MQQADTTLDRTGMFDVPDTPPESHCAQTLHGDSGTRRAHACRPSVHLRAFQRADGSTAHDGCEEGPLLAREVGCVRRTSHVPARTESAARTDCASQEGGTTPPHSSAAARRRAHGLLRPPVRPMGAAALLCHGCLAKSSTDCPSAGCHFTRGLCERTASVYTLNGKLSDGSNQVSNGSS